VVSLSLTRLSWYRCLHGSLPHARRGIVAVFGVAVAVFGFALSFSRPAWYRCGIRRRSSGIRLRSIFLTPGVVSLRYSAPQERNSASLYLSHARRGIVAVFGVAVAVFGFALSFSRPAWYRCGIRRRRSGIRLRSIFLTPGVVSLRYSASQERNSASLYLSHAWRGIVAVFGVAVAAFGFALSFSHPAWYRCGIRRRRSGIRLRSIFLTPGVASLRYSASQ